MAKRKPSKYAIGDWEPSKTQQHFKDQCDINHIWKRYRKTGIIEHVERFNGVYGDFTNAPMRLEDALMLVRDGEREFMKLPAEIRSRFNDNMQAFVDFASDPRNVEEMKRMGLIKPTKPEQAVAPVTDPAPVEPPPTGA